MNKGTILCVIFILLLAPSTLSSNVQQARSDTTRPNKSLSPKNSSFASLYSNVTTHQGDLIINGTETYIIENCTYIQNGNLYVRDQANLKITNSVLLVSQHYNYQYKFAVENDTTLEIKNSTVSGTYEGPGLSFGGTSHGIINSSSLERTPISSGDESDVSIAYSTFQEAGAGGSSQMLIVSSEFIWATNLYFDGDDTVSLNGLKPGYCDYWNMHADLNVTNVPWNLTLINTYVVAWSISLEYDTSAFVSNSIIERVALSFYNHDFNVEGVRPQVYQNWKLYNMTFMNVTVTGCWVLLFFDDAMGVVANSSAYLSVYSGSENITVQGSYVLLTADQFISGNLVFNNSTFTISHLGLHNSAFFVQGNTLTIKPEWEWSWVLTNLTRNYCVTLGNPNSASVSDVKLTLFNQHNAIVWEGLTDTLGQTDFNLTFTDSNYTDTLRLEAVKGNLSAMTNVLFLSETPVILTLGLHDIAAIGVAPAKTVVGQGFSLPVNVTIANQGTFNETYGVTVTLYANTKWVKTETSYNLANGTSTILSFIWDTTGFELGNYTMTAYAWPVPGETDTADNNLTLGWVLVALTGDITGSTGWPDGKVDMRDIGVVARHFGETVSPASSNLDIYEDGKIDMRDIGIVARHFLEHYP